MAVARTIRAEPWRVFALSLASLFVIPAATLFFTRCALQSDDVDFIERIDVSINAATGINPQKLTSSPPD